MTTLARRLVVAHWQGPSGYHALVANYRLDLVVDPDLPRSTVEFVPWHIDLDFRTCLGHVATGHLSPQSLGAIYRASALWPRKRAEEEGDTLLDVPRVVEIGEFLDLAQEFAATRVRERAGMRR